MNDKEKSIVAGIELSQVKSAYSGRVNTCCCGCAGKHYKKGESMNSDRQIKRIFNFVKATFDNRTSAEPFFVNPECISADTETRSYIFYTT